MTAQKHLKQLVRARMAKTGESYSTARRQLIRQAVPPTTSARYPRHFPGSVPAATALRTLLAHAGVRAAHTKQPFSEAMVFGIAGGIGAGMFTFHYAKENFSSFYVAGRYLWYDNLAWSLAAVKRLGAKSVVKEASGAKPAEQALRQLLESGRPVLAWMTFRGQMYHLVTVHGIEGGEALVADLGDELIRVPLPALAEGRARVKKDKHRLLALEPAGKTPPLEQLVREGVAACADGLAKGRMKNFTLEAFATWADRLDGSKGGAADSWEKLFPRGPLLYQGLRSITEYIEYYGTGGGLSRPLFAEFLEEAGSALGEPRLATLSRRYTELGQHWTAVADAALPDEVPIFRRTKELLGERQEAVTAHGEDEAVGRASCWAALKDASDSMQEGFPLSEAECVALRRELQGRVRELVAEEKAALGEMQGWLGTGS